jgi:hypothetical protein
VRPSSYVASRAVDRAWSSTGSIASSSGRLSRRAIRSRKRSTTRASARLGLKVFLTDPDVPTDTNYLERALRVIPMARKSWPFCWSELGARQVGIVQSLIVTCRLHGIDPYTIWSMSCSASVSIPPHASPNSPQDCGSRTSRPIPSALHGML